LRRGDVAWDVSNKRLCGFGAWAVLGARVGVADHHSLAAQEGTVQGVHRGLRAVVTLEFHEANAARPAGVNIKHHFGGDDQSEYLEALT
jgi:hypothetical protein